MRITLKLTGVLGFLTPFKDQEETYTDFIGNKVGDLVDHLLSKMEPNMKHMLLDEQGQLSPELLVLINERPLFDLNRLNQQLREGDFVELHFFAG